MMPKTLNEHMQLLDDINDELIELQENLSSKVRAYYKLKAQYERIEAKTFGEAPDGVAIKDKEYLAKVIADEQHEELFTRYMAAKGEKDIVEKKLKTLELRQSGTQSKLKHRPGA